jgi:hypothetical protein
VLPQNEERTYLLGVWWVSFVNKACNTITAYKSGPDKWLLVENWTERDGFLFHKERYDLSGNGDPDEVSAIIECIVQGYVDNGNVAKLARIDIRSDGEDIYQRVHDIFVGIGVADQIQFRQSG